MQNTERGCPGSERMDSGIPRMQRSHSTVGDSSDVSGNGLIPTPRVMSADSQWRKII